MKREILNINNVLRLSFEAKNIEQIELLNITLIYFIYIIKKLEEATQYVKKKIQLQVFRLNK